MWFAREKELDYRFTALTDDITRRFDEIYRLMEYREREHRAAHDREHGLVETATTAALESLNKRLEGHNEFREQLNQQAKDLMPRKEQEQSIQAVRNEHRADMESMRREQEQLSKIAQRSLGMASLFVLVLIPVLLYYLS